MGRRYLYILLKRNLLANINWRTGLPSSNDFKDPIEYLRYFGKGYTACFSEGQVSGCETNNSMLIYDTYNAIILNELRDIDKAINKYAMYLAPGGVIYIGNEPVYTKEHVTVYVPCNALTTHGGVLTPLDIYSYDWHVVGCDEVSEGEQVNAGITIKVCEKHNEKGCIDPLELMYRLNFMKPIP